MSITKLRPYEKDWINKVRQSKFRRLLLVGPTGSGKTVVAASMIKDLIRTGHKVLFVAHRRELVLQARQRLLEYGVPEFAIGVIMSGEPWPTGDELVYIASIQTLLRRGVPEDIDVVFVDEAHHTSADSYQKIINSCSKSTKLIGLTATPWRLDGKCLGDCFDEIIECEKISKLIEDGYISSPRVFTVPPEFRGDVSDVRINRTDFNQHELSNVVNTKQLVGSIVDHWIKYNPKRLPTICYAVSLAHAESICDAFLAADIEAVFIDHKTSIEDRAILIECLKNGEVKVLVNVELLIEGFDCGNVRFAILARPTMSLPFYKQMCGRVMRPGEWSMIMDHAGNCIRHQLHPADDMEYLLTKSCPKVSREAPEKTCPVCGCRNFLGCKNCTFCGYEFWSDKMPEEIEAQLVEFESTDTRIPCPRCGGEMIIASMAKRGRGCSKCTKKVAKKAPYVPCPRCDSGEMMKACMARMGCGCSQCIRKVAKKEPRIPCPRCGGEMITASRAKRCRGCSKCTKKRAKKAQRVPCPRCDSGEMITASRARVGGGCSQCSNSKSKSNIPCPRCPSGELIQASKAKNGHGCSQCTKKRAK